jgi:hypothetical protein
LAAASPAPSWLHSVRRGPESSVVVGPQTRSFPSSVAGFTSDLPSAQFLGAMGEDCSHLPPSPFSSDTRTCRGCGAHHSSPVPHLPYVNKGVELNALYSFPPKPRQSVEGYLQPLKWYSPEPAVSASDLEGIIMYSRAETQTSQGSWFSILSTSLHFPPTSAPSWWG